MFKALHFRIQKDIGKMDLPDIIVNLKYDFVFFTEQRLYYLQAAATMNASTRWSTRQNVYRKFRERSLRRNREQKRIFYTRQPHIQTHEIVYQENDPKVQTNHESILHL